MKNLLKDKRVLVGALVLAGLVSYYLYDKNKKAKIKAGASAMASHLTPTDISKNGIESVDLDLKSEGKPLHNASSPVTVQQVY